MGKCTANITDDVQCGYIEGNYIKKCDARECMPGLEFEQIPIVYYMMMVCLFFMVVLSTVALVFSV